MKEKQNRGTRSRNPPRETVGSRLLTAGRSKKEKQKEKAEDKIPPRGRAEGGRAVGGRAEGGRVGKTGTSEKEREAERVSRR